MKCKELTSCILRALRRLRICFSQSYTRLSCNINLRKGSDLLVRNEMNAFCCHVDNTTTVKKLWFPGKKFLPRYPQVAIRDRTVHKSTGKRATLSHSSVFESNSSQKFAIACIHPNTTELTVSKILSLIYSCQPAIASETRTKSHFKFQNT